MTKPGTRIQTSTEAAIYPLTAVNSLQSHKNSKFDVFEFQRYRLFSKHRPLLRVLQYTASPRLSSAQVLDCTRNVAF
jgi:hypothetical protein